MNRSEITPTMFFSANLPYRRRLTANPSLELNPIESTELISRVGKSRRLVPLKLDAAPLFVETGKG